MLTTGATHIRTVGRLHADDVNLQLWAWALRDCTFRGMWSISMALILGLFVGWSLTSASCGVKGNEMVREPRGYQGEGQAQVAQVERSDEEVLGPPAPEGPRVPARPPSLCLKATSGNYVDLKDNRRPQSGKHGKSFGSIGRRTIQATSRHGGECGLLGFSLDGANSKVWQERKRTRRTSCKGYHHRGFAGLKIGKGS